MFKVNEGSLDRIIRIVSGIILLSLTVIGPETSWGYIGIIPILTGLWGWCPLYKVFGINTCNRKK